MKPSLAEAGGALGSFHQELSGVMGLAAIFLRIVRWTHSWAGAVLAAAMVPTLIAHRPGSLEEGALWVPATATVTGLALEALGPGPQGARGCSSAPGVGALGFACHCSGALLGVLLPAANVALSWASAHRSSEGRAPAPNLRPSTLIEGGRA